jgi:hypothetical protein
MHLCLMSVTSDTITSQYDWSMPVDLFRLVLRTPSAFLVLFRHLVRLSSCILMILPTASAYFLLAKEYDLCPSFWSVTASLLPMLVTWKGLDTQYVHYILN